MHYFEDSQSQVQDESIDALLSPSQECPTHSCVPPEDILANELDALGGIQERLQCTNFQSLLERSNRLGIDFPTKYNTLSHLNGQGEEIKDEVERNAKECYPILHEKTVNLIIHFLEHKKRFGSNIERALYSSNEAGTVEKFIERLLRKRPLAFLGSCDSYLLRDGRSSGAGGWEAVGTPGERPPLVLRDYLSYDEIAVAALLGVSCPSHFVNAGSRGNSGRRGVPGHFEESGVYIGLVGARFEREDQMESRFMLIQEKYSTSRNGYGSRPPPGDDEAQQGERDYPEKTNDFMRMWAQLYFGMQKSTSSLSMKQQQSSLNQKVGEEKKGQQNTQEDRDMKSGVVALREMGYNVSEGSEASVALAVAKGDANKAVELLYFQESRLEEVTNPMLISNGSLLNIKDSLSDQTTDLKTQNKKDNEEQEKDVSECLQKKRKKKSTILDYFGSKKMEGKTDCVDQQKECQQTIIPNSNRDQNHYFPTYAEASKTFRDNKKQKRFIPVGYSALSFLDAAAFRARCRLALAPFLLDADARARARGRRAYAHAVGLGLGVWQVCGEQGRLMVDVYAEIIREHELHHVSDLDFSYFPSSCTECGGATDGEVLRTSNGNSIRIHFSRRNPAAKLRGEDTGKLVVAMYAWDGNAFAGNEYYMGMLAASGDPAAACCSTIPELQNPYINPMVCGANARVVVEGGAGLRTLPEYLAQRRGSSREGVAGSASLPIEGGGGCG